MPAEETRKIFLCYRRDDSGDATGRLYDRLALEFGDKSIFMDVDGVRLGTNFVKRLTAEVESCDALLAVIGPNWLDARDEQGNRGLDDRTILSASRLVRPSSATSRAQRDQNPARRPTAA
jgi:hypothetical protein